MQSDEKYRHKSSLLYADISGFTKLVATLSKRGKEGLEEIASFVNVLYGLFIQTSQALGGQFINAAGDSVLVSLPFSKTSEYTVSIIRKLLKERLDKYKKVFPEINTSVKTALIIDDFEHKNFYWKDKRFSIIKGPSKEILSDLDLKEEESNFQPLPLIEKSENIPFFLANDIEYPAIINPEHRVVISMMIGVSAPKDFNFKKFIDTTGETLSEFNGEICDIDCISKTGFKTLILFGHRTDNDTSFENILFCAKKILKSDQLNSNNSRIGISAGYAYTGTLNVEDQSKFLAIGDDINLSERLTRIATENEILFSEKFKNLLPSKVKFTRFKKTSIPKYPDKLNYYRLEGIKEKKMFFVDRINELNQAKDLIRENQSAIQITGEQGIGKTAFLEKIKNFLLADYNVILAVKKRDDSPVFLSEEIIHQIRYSADLPNISSISQASRIGIYSDRIANALKSKIPFALLIDDADMKSIDLLLLDKLMDFVEKSGSIIIITSRSAFDIEKFARIKLKPFGFKNTSELLSKEMGVKRIEKPLLHYIVNITKGNPLFSSMLINYLENFSFLKKTALSASLKKIPRRVPENIALVSMAKFNTMDKKIKNTLKTASIVGNSFSESILTKLTGDPETPLYLSQSSAQGILETRRGIYNFKIPFFREVLQDSVVSFERKTIHLKTAKILSEDKESIETLNGEIAYHYHMAGKKDYAFPLYMRGIQSALNEKHPEKALKYIELAQQLAKNEDEMYKLLFKKAESYSIQGNTRGHDICMKKCLLWAKKKNDLLLLYELYKSIGLYHFFNMDLKKSIYSYKKALLLSSGQNKEFLYILLSDVYWRLGKIEESEKYLDLFSKNQVRTKQKDNQFNYLHRRGLIAYAKNDYQSALNYFLKSSLLVKEYHSMEYLFNDIAETYFLLGEIDKAVFYIKKALRCSKKIGYNWTLANLSMNHAIFLSEKGLFEKALRKIERSIKISDIVYPHINIVARTNKMLILMKSGKLSGLKDDFDKIRAKATIGKNIYLKIFADYAWVLFLKKKGDKKIFKKALSSLLKTAKKNPPILGNISGIYITYDDIVSLQERRKK
ncbi:hypothetical protein JXA84_00155 [candidate division WOR-3 bacterium]|nr:hypothetical protein [candidate division WOR-3 bacterium]